MDAKLNTVDASRSEPETQTARARTPYAAKSVDVYRPRHQIRIVTAASLFDGHDAAINIMRRILQASGAEVIHLGHDRSVDDVVSCAIQEDANAIAMTSYQGGHVEYLKYMHDRLQTEGCGQIRIFAGGGGVILPSEVEELHAYGIERVYTPDDGRELGLQGMINDLLRRSDFPTGKDVGPADVDAARQRDARAIARIISGAENYPAEHATLLAAIRREAATSNIPVLGITGTGGAGKSSLIDELVRRYLQETPDCTIGIVSVDPSKRKTGGALLGDRIRMNAVHGPRVYMRSLATRQANLALSSYVRDAVDVFKLARFDLIILETSGIGQSDTEIVDHADVSLYVMTPEYGAATQLEKIDMLDFADVVAINKFDKRGALDALRDVRKQFQRNHKRFGDAADRMPVVGTIASQFNDPGTTRLYQLVMLQIADRFGRERPPAGATQGESEKIDIIPPDRARYLSRISERIREYNAWVEQQSGVAHQLQAATDTEGMIGPVPALSDLRADLERRLDAANRDQLARWPETRANYEGATFRYQVRGKELAIPTTTRSLSHLEVPKVALPHYRDHGDLLTWLLQENVPGAFPYTAGVFPFKREGEDPTRMFAGEGGPERTNRRFHYVSMGQPAHRLSTAFDSVTLYGNDPAMRPDIYGKIGNAGVSVCCLDDAKRLYSGFDLTDPATSVSMTINGPAPMLTAFFMNTAIDQQCERYIREQGLVDQVESTIAASYAASDVPRPRYRGELPAGHDGLGLMLLGTTGDRVLPDDVYQRIRAETIAKVRGTVQADILKEDQAQNTCIFSTEFALKLMGDVQEYFTRHNIRNFYSVSISGYHIAEAGANPISQLAFTLANGFTYVEYYLSRGLPIDAFAPNLSFFFSNGSDPEYAVIGRVARRIWAKALKFVYQGGARSQMLKYHVQTSGRSLHAQEISFNDIRTTLQALYAIFDNCNSLHTNAYDEAITTPTEESVRRAMAIQLIINHEFGLARNQNPLQGSFIIERLTEMVEDAVLQEFDRISDRGGVLGAMETMYQRGRIQEESLEYETLKHTGELPIIGVNTFLSSEGSPTSIPAEVIRSTPEEKDGQIDTVASVHRHYATEAPAVLARLQEAARHNQNVFAELMETAKVCTLGQIAGALFAVGGQYRRSM
jgi:methylmalonyl-CoA mutase